MKDVERQGAELRETRRNFSVDRSEGAKIKKKEETGERRRRQLWRPVPLVEFAKFPDIHVLWTPDGRGAVNENRKIVQFPSRRGAREEFHEYISAAAIDNFSFLRAFTRRPLLPVSHIYRTCIPRESPERPYHGTVPLFTHISASCGTRERERERHEREH